MSAAMAAVDVGPHQRRESGLRRSFHTRLVGMTALLLALAGCGSAGQEPAGLGPDEQSTQAASKEPTGPDLPPADSTASSPSATAPTSPALPPGLSFEDVPEASGKAAAALNAYLGLEAEIWRSFLDAKLSPELTTFATEPVVADWEASVKYLRDHDMVGGGRIVITPTIARVSDQLVLINGCADMSELTNIVDGKEAPPEEVVENPTWVIEALVMVDQASGGGWKVSEYRQEPGRC
jgi:hypothetical protein